MEPNEPTDADEFGAEYYPDEGDSGVDAVEEPSPRAPRAPQPQGSRAGGHQWKLAAALVVAVLVAGLFVYRNGAIQSQQTKADQAVVDHSNQLSAQVTVNAVIAADSRLAAFCPQGWDDSCADTFAAQTPPVSPPVCAVATLVPVSASNATAYTKADVVMDDACRAAWLKRKFHQSEVDRQQPSRLEQVLLGTSAYQEEMFAEDSSRIDLLKFDRRLSREVILKHWTDPGMGYKILAHPSLTPADCAQIYGVIQANGWLDAMPYLLINPNLDPGLKGAWIARPQADPAQREQTILLGLHQPSVAAGMIHYLVDQAIEDGNAGDLTLWNILLKAAANGDLPVNRCHLATDKDQERQVLPVCGDATGWDFVQQMKEAQEANVAFPAPSAAGGWEVVHKACEWESMAGRHAKGSVAAAPLVVPKMADVLPPVR